MTGEERRREIMNILTSAPKPVSGMSLAYKFQISRQIIVQDIALLRAENKNIISTNRGYMLYHSSQNRNIHRRIFEVSHAEDQILEEFYCIVDSGGTILNVSIDHELYGLIETSLFISNRADARDFAKKMASCKDKPLSTLTRDLHFHTVEAPSEKSLDSIEASLKEKGFLIV